MPAAGVSVARSVKAPVAERVAGSGVPVGEELYTSRRIAPVLMLAIRMSPLPGSAPKATGLFSDAICCTCTGPLDGNVIAKMRLVT